MKTVDEVFQEILDSEDYEESIQILNNWKKEIRADQHEKTRKQIINKMLTEPNFKTSNIKDIQNES